MSDAIDGSLKNELKSVNIFKITTVLMKMHNLN